MKLIYRRIIALSSVAILALGVIVLSGWRSGILWPPKAPGSYLPAVASNLPILNNDASAGTVTFTFDDGPDTYTMQTLATLRAEHVPAVFFVIGDKVVTNPAMVKAEHKYGFVVGNHTWDHSSLTGASTNGTPLTAVQVTAELVKTQNAIVAADVPAPTLWRAPYDDVSQNDANIATKLGLRLVNSYGQPGYGNIVDSQDWSGISTATIVQYITQGYVANNDSGKIYPATPAQRAYGLAHNGKTADPNVVYFHGAQAGSILSFHDGLSCGPNVIAAIPLIVKYLNQHHLGATSVVRPNALGGVLTQTGSGGGSG